MGFPTNGSLSLKAEYGYLQGLQIFRAVKHEVSDRIRYQNE